MTFGSLFAGIGGLTEPDVGRVVEVRTITHPEHGAEAAIDIDE